MNDETLSFVLCLECDAEVPLYLLTCDGFGLTGFCPHCRMPLVLPRRRVVAAVRPGSDAHG